MDRNEHLEWAKERAREYLDQGDGNNAITSILSDLNKHPDLAKSAELMGPIAMFEMMNGGLTGARSFIEGFN